MKNNVDYTQKHTNKKLRVLSTCTGYRGIEIGMEMAGEELTTVAYVEIESFVIANLVKAMETNSIPAAPIWTNLKTFNARPFCGAVDIITGGYPCQPFSLAGQRKGAYDPRHLWPYYEKIIAAARPFQCFFENVEGHVTNGFADVYKSLRTLGYRVEAGLYTSKETGGSHIRKRLFILAELDGTRLLNETVRQLQAAGVKQSSQSELANSNNTKSSGRYRAVSEKNGEVQQWDNHSEHSNSSKKLANSQSNEPRRLRERKEKEKPSTVESNKELADTRTKRLQRKKQSEPRGGGGEYGMSTPKRCPIAPPGVFQFEWEEPRENTKEALKSRLGLSANGYDYRTDFLRSLGNGVDPFTAKTAWIDLNDKMKNNVR